MITLNFLQAFAVLVLIAALWALYGAIWRLFFSPIAHFPGPTLAALTLWYEFYYDVLKPGGGQYIWKIEELHEKYGNLQLHHLMGIVCLTIEGPIVRINPYELHVSDPDFYEKLYAGGAAKRDKYHWHVKGADSPNAIGFTVDHDLHKLRRDAVNPYFSKRSVAKLEPLFRNKADRLCERLQQFLETQTPLNLTCAYLALFMDIIGEYAFADDYGLLNHPDFDYKWKETILCIMRAMTVISHFGWMPVVLKSLPTRIANLVSPDMSSMFQYQRRIHAQVEQVLNHSGIYGQTGRKKKTMFEELRDSEKLPAEEKTSKRLSDDGAILVVAASETPAKVLAIIHYHLMNKPAIMQKLRAELRAEMGNGKTIPSLNQLEKLPYLTAILQEGLRLHNGVTARSQRIAYESLQYKGWVIPPRTPVSCISVFIHYNKDLFPEPRAFKPERWLEKRSDGMRLERYLFAFSKGSRICLGYNLAWAELYITLATVVSRFDMELYQTSFEDVDLKHDWFIPQPKAGSLGVRAMVVGKVN